MNKKRFIFVLGVIIILMPIFSGFPSFWEKVIYVCLGLAISITSFVEIQKIKKERSLQKPFDSRAIVFEENLSKVEKDNKENTLENPLQ